MFKNLELLLENNKKKGVEFLADLNSWPSVHKSSVFPLDQNRNFFFSFKVVTRVINISLVFYRIYELTKLCILYKLYKVWIEGRLLQPWQFSTEKEK